VWSRCHRHPFESRLFDVSLTRWAQIPYGSCDDRICMLNYTVAGASSLIGRQFTTWRRLATRRHKTTAGLSFSIIMNRLQQEWRQRCTSHQILVIASIFYFITYIFLKWNNSPNLRRQPRNKLTLTVLESYALLPPKSDTQHNLRKRRHDLTLHEKKWHLSTKTLLPVKETRPKWRPRPRPVKQQQEYMTEKNLLLQHARLLSKNNLVQITSRKRWPVTFGTVSVVIARKNTGDYYISASYHVTQRLVGTYSVGSKTKSIRLRLSCKMKDQDRGRSETGFVKDRGLRPQDCLYIAIVVLRNFPSGVWQFWCFLNTIVEELLMWQ